MDISEKGICRLSIVPVRVEGNDRAEVVTQMLFGDHYEVLQIETNWLKIKIYFDGYEGWIDSKQHYQISEAYFNQINNSDYKVCTDLTSSILFNKHRINIVLGSILPISTNEIFKVEEQLAFNGEAKSLSQRRDFEFVKQIAAQYLNTPYLWGGRSPFGIDCSGFVQNVFRISGYKLPRDAYQQATIGEAVESIMPGDLAFFAKDAKIDHVGICLGEGEIIHASGKVRVDKIGEGGIKHADSGQLTHKLHSVRRILKH